SARRASQTPNRSPHNYPSLPSRSDAYRQRPDPEVPLRVLIDKALHQGGYVLSPLAAPHHRREGLVYRWPSDQGSPQRPSPGGGRGHPSLTYQPQLTFVPARRGAKSQGLASAATASPRP